MDILRLALLIIIKTPLTNQVMNFPLWVGARRQNRNILSYSHYAPSLQHLPLLSFQPPKFPFSTNTVNWQRKFNIQQLQLGEGERNEVIFFIK